ncbi:MAG: ferritin-like domain-containing protein [Acidimicrobiales bacterium]
MILTENELWLLSFYRTSEIRGSLFFGRLAQIVRPGPVQHDLSRHFADEALHGWYWTDCIDRLGARPLKLADAYQDQYLEAAGLPVNMMEILAVTQVFERRVVRQYNAHLRLARLDPRVAATIRRIMADERWHFQWVRDALEGMTARYGQAEVAAALDRYTRADHEVYAATLAEHRERLGSLPFVMAATDPDAPTEEET